MYVGTKIRNLTSGLKMTQLKNSSVGAEPIPGVLGWEVEYRHLVRSPVHHRFTQRHTFTRDQRKQGSSVLTPYSLLLIQQTRKPRMPLVCTFFIGHLLLIWLIFYYLSLSNEATAESITLSFIKWDIQHERHYLNAVDFKDAFKRCV